MIKQKLLLVSIVTLSAICGASQSQAQRPGESEEIILKLMEEIFLDFSGDIAEINPELKRIAVYRLAVEKRYISEPVRDHFEGRLVELLGSLERPAVVSLPELNTLKINSSDSSFSIINSLPSPEELWKVGRKLRVDAFLEGNLVYLPGKALMLDLRLNRTGTNEVLWAKSYTALEKKLELPSVNPIRTSLSAGIDVFQIDVVSGNLAILHPDFKDRLTQYSVYLGIFQYLTPKSRLRYDVRVGASFLSQGVRLLDTGFTTNSFYSPATDSRYISKISSYNLRSSLLSSIAENKDNPAGDWLSAYLSVTRYFAVNMPDLTGIGLGLRSDINSHFSLSAGISIILGPEFDSRSVASTGETVRLKVGGLHYELMLLQYTF